jgi:predicted GNAT family acetyltransferase
VYVGPGYRRRGVYRALDEYVRTEALRDGGVCGLRLYVDRDNHVAQSVYSSLDMQLSHYDLFEIDFIL